jgi:hypothetical protein
LIFSVDFTEFFFLSLCQEPKLSAARRIVSEWSNYDEEMQRLAHQIAKDKAAAAAAHQQQAGSSLNKDEL